MVTDALSRHSEAGSLDSSMSSRHGHASVAASDVVASHAEHRHAPWPLHALAESAHPNPNAQSTCPSLIRNRLRLTDGVADPGSAHFQHRRRSRSLSPDHTRTGLAAALDSAATAQSTFTINPLADYDNLHSCPPGHETPYEAIPPRPSLDARLNASRSHVETPPLRRQHRRHTDQDLTSQRTPVSPEPRRGLSAIRAFLGRLLHTHHRTSPHHECDDAATDEYLTASCSNLDPVASTTRACPIPHTVNSLPQPHTPNPAMLHRPLPHRPDSVLADMDDRVPVAYGNWRDGHSHAAEVNLDVDAGSAFSGLDEGDASLASTRASAELNQLYSRVHHPATSPSPRSRLATPTLALGAEVEDNEPIAALGGHLHRASQCSNTSSVYGFGTDSKGSSRPGSSMDPPRRVTLSVDRQMAVLQRRSASARAGRADDVRVTHTPSGFPLRKASSVHGRPQSNKLKQARVVFDDSNAMNSADSQLLCPPSLPSRPCSGEMRRLLSMRSMASATGFEEADDTYALVSEAARRWGPAKESLRMSRQLATGTRSSMASEHSDGYEPVSDEPLAASSPDF